MKTRLTILLASLLLVATLAPAATAEPIEFGIDGAHSAVAFKVRHFFTQVPGHFDTFDGAIVYDPEKPENSSVQMTVQADSIDTGNENRDGHLRSADFFEVETYPTLSFQSEERTGRYVAEPVPGAAPHTFVREQLRRKYGWRDRWVGLLVDTSASVAVRLTALEE